MMTNPQTVMRILDRIGKGTHNLVTKHPALTAGAVGVGLGAAHRGTDAQQLEKKLMHKMMKTSQNKYSSCPEMNKFAAKKITLAVRSSLTKIAEPAEFLSGLTNIGLEGVARGAGSAAAKEGVGGLRSMLGAAFQAIKDTFFVEPKRQQMAKKIIETDPTVRTQEREQPGTVLQAYKTMSRFAPTLSTDPNIATSFMRNAAMSGGALDYQVVKGLADAEAAVQRAKNEGAWMRRGF